jgi:hypothetical protein
MQLIESAICADARGGYGGIRQELAEGNMSEQDQRERELEEVPLRRADKTTWPTGVKAIAIDEADALGVDAAGNLYWPHGKQVETRARLALNWSQTFVAVVIAVATVIGAVAAVVQGWTAYNDWACKVRWSAVACPPEPATLAADSERTVK